MVMTTHEIGFEQKQVHVALSAFVSALVNSTSLKTRLVNNVSNSASGDGSGEPRKYRPSEDTASSPTEFSF